MSGTDRPFVVDYEPCVKAERAGSCVCNLCVRCVVVNVDSALVDDLAEFPVSNLTGA